jgi:hypothetical protein
MSSLSDLFEFLHAPNPDARELALANLAGHTPKNTAARSIFIPNGSTPVWKDLQAGLGQAVSEDEKKKVEMLEDLKTLCRDQAVSGPGKPPLYKQQALTLPCRDCLDDRPRCILVASELERYVTSRQAPGKPRVPCLPGIIHSCKSGLRTGFFF